MKKYKSYTKGNLPNNKNTATTHSHVLISVRWIKHWLSSAPALGPLGRRRGNRTQINERKSSLSDAQQWRDGERESRTGRGRSVHQIFSALVRKRRNWEGREFCMCDGLRPRSTRVCGSRLTEGRTWVDLRSTFLSCRLASSSLLKVRLITGRVCVCVCALAKASFQAGCHGNICLYLIFFIFRIDKGRALNESEPRQWPALHGTGQESGSRQSRTEWFQEVVQNTYMYLLLCISVLRPRKSQRDPKWTK